MPRSAYSHFTKFPTGLSSPLYAVGTWPAFLGELGKTCLVYSLPQDPSPLSDTQWVTGKPEEKVVDADVETNERVSSDGAKEQPPPCNINKNITP